MDRKAYVPFFLIAMLLLAACSPITLVKANSDNTQQAATATTQITLPAPTATPAATAAPTLIPTLAPSQILRLLRLPSARQRPQGIMVNAKLQK